MVPQVRLCGFIEDPIPSEWGFEEPDVSVTGDIIQTKHWSTCVNTRTSVKSQSRVLHPHRYYFSLHILFHCDSPPPPQRTRVSGTACFNHVRLPPAHSPWDLKLQISPRVCLDQLSRVVLQTTITCNAVDCRRRPSPLLWLEWRHKSCGEIGLKSRGSALLCRMQQGCFTHFRCVNCPPLAMR